MKRLFLSLALALGIFAIPLPSFATVQSTIDKKIYQGDGISTVFSFPYNIYLATDVAVYETVTATNNTTQLTLNTNYTVTLTAISGVTGAYTATINLAGGSSPAGALAVGTQLTILRSLPLTQLINISDYSATPAATWNQALDRDVIREQQLQEQINRAILAPVNSTAPSGYTLPNPVANAYIGWDATGTFLTNLIAAQPLGPTASPTFAGLTITGLNGIAKYSSGVLGTANADVDYSVPNGVETLTNKTYDTAGAGNVFKINGTQITGVVGSGKVLLGSSAPLTGYTVQGSTTVIPTVSGVPTINNCAKFDANHNLVDNGSTCSGGTGMVYPASAGIPITDTSSWKTSLAEVDGDIIYGTGGAWAVQAAPIWNQNTTGTLTGLVQSTVSGTSYITGGNVGIGTTAPVAKFVISNAGANGLEINPGTTAFGLTNVNYIASYDRSLSAYKDVVFDEGGGSGDLVLKAGGNVGIGKASPTHTLDVNGTINASGAITGQLTGGSSILSGNGSGGFSNVTIGTGLSFTGGTLTSTVTSQFVPNNIQVFTSSGTWTKPAGISSVYVKVWGAGGGGGDYAATDGGLSSFAGSSTMTANGGKSGVQNGGGGGGTASGAGGFASGGSINFTGNSGGTYSGTNAGIGGIPFFGAGFPGFVQNIPSAPGAMGFAYGGNGNSSSHGGGGAGGYSEGVISVSGNVTVTVGTGGTSGGSGTPGGMGLVIVYY